MQLYDKAKTDELLALKLDDAPSDGSTYARKDAGWVTIPTGTKAVNTVSTDYTLVLTDGGNIIYVTGASGYPGNGITVPDNASVAFPVGTQVDCFFNNGNTGFIVAGTGVTLYGSTTVNNQTGVTLTQVATDVWFIK